MATTIPNLHSIRLRFWQNYSYTLAGLWNTDFLYNRVFLSFVPAELSSGLFAFSWRCSDNATDDVSYETLQVK